MKLSIMARVLALAAFVMPAIATAQTASSAAAPSGVAPMQAPCVVQDNGSCAAIKASVPLPVADLDSVAVPFTPGAASGAVLFSTPTSRFAGVSFQATGTWAGTVTIEGANDASADCLTGGTWASLTSMNLNGGNPATSINGNTIMFIPAGPLCARARITTYTSGTVAGVAVLRSLTPLPATTQINNYKAQLFTEVSNASVAASATKINYSTRDLGSGTSNYSRFGCYFNPGAASMGALGYVEGSPDNTNWVSLRAPVDLSGLVPVILETRIFYRYNRCAFANGMTAQTGLYVASQFGD
jgi:hypothetical protein